MNCNIEHWTIEELLKYKNDNMLSANPEYQRGLVWTDEQRKKLIDSIFRNYTLPIIYLHHKSKGTGKFISNVLEIVDGQQRIHALELYTSGAIVLYDPKKDDKKARFPDFIKNQPCPWGGKSFENLSKDEQDAFLNKTLVVALITTDEDNEARDLFIRLQAGTALNAQEKRDAWPGTFTEYILKKAGKKNNDKYPGHDFFSKKVYSHNKDRGQKRQLCAQVFMLIDEFNKNGQYVELKSQMIDEYYYKNLSIDLHSKECQRFDKLIDLAFNIFNTFKNMKPLKGYEVIHTMLLINALLDDYTPSWKERFNDVFEGFRMEVAKSNKSKSGKVWELFTSFTRTSSDSKSSIIIRHQLFTRYMLDKLKPVLKDETRLYGEVERELIYYCFEKKCQVCDTIIPWNDLEIHHIDEHYRGGKTLLENGVPVHKVCHPKGLKAEEMKIEFKEKSRLAWDKYEMFDLNKK